MTRKPALFLILTAILCLFLQACSINKMAMKAVSNALTREGGANVFTSDSDPQLVGDALPFAIKMYESLLSVNPEHQGLLKASGSLFVMYANAFVQGPIEQLPRSSFDEREAAMERARKLYLRGFELLCRGLELKYPGFGGAFSGAFPERAMPAFLAKMKKEDVPSLYWAAVGGVSAFSINPFDIGLGLMIPDFLSFVERAYELDADFNSGALDEFLLLFYASVPESMGGDKARAALHFQKALEKSRGLLAGPYVSYAQAVSIPLQDYDTFKAHLETALAVDVDADPVNRLVNIISQRKARRLLDSAAYYFVNIGNDNWDWDEEDW
jgi:predicted anti-sigma-YlaC factor YlaD